jgi:hypothetical protein
MGPAAVGFAQQRQRIAELREQRQLEATQQRRLLGARRQLAQCRLVTCEETRMRILARQQLEQELVQIEAAKQSGAAHERQPAAPLRLDERLELLLAGP